MHRINVFFGGEYIIDQGKGRNAHRQENHTGLTNQSVALQIVLEVFQLGQTIRDKQEIVFRRKHHFLLGRHVQGARVFADGVGAVDEVFDEGVCGDSVDG
jgi:hypothetical protein